MSKKQKSNTSYKQYKRDLAALDLATFDELDELPRNKQIEALLPLVINIAHEMKVPGHFLEDAVSVGNIALIEALDKWEPGKAPVQNWVARDIKRDMNRYVNKERKWEFRRESIDHPPMADSASDDEVYSEDEMALAAALQRVLTQASCDDHEQPDNCVDQTLAITAVRELKPRDQAVVFGHVVNGLTMQQVADTLGISKGRVGQIIDESMTKLRRILTKEKYLR